MEPVVCGIDGWPTHDETRRERFKQITYTSLSVVMSANPNLSRGWVVKFAHCFTHSGAQESSGVVLTFKSFTRRK